MTNSTSDRIPVTVLTGFLGSGKTTLLNRLLKSPAMGKTAVVVNELGEIGIDHILVEHSTEELVLLSNGCLCCAVREDLVSTLRDLAFRRKRGEIGAFQSLLIETTGLADPVPVVHSLMSDISLVTQYRFGGIITTVDSVNGLSTLHTHPEALKQVALADHVLLTKTDLASPEQREVLTHQLRQLNTATPPELSSSFAATAALRCLHADYDPCSKVEMMEDWLRSDAYERQPGGRHGRGKRNETPIRSFCVVRDEPLSWDIVSEWLDTLTVVHGESLLRVKGIVNVGEDSAKPIVVHAVQHLFHPPSVLNDWPSTDRRSRFVFITLGMDEFTVDEALRALERGKLAPVH